MTILRDWLKKQKMSQCDFARNIGIHPNYFSNLMCGRFHLSVKIAKKIEQYTQGDIKAASLLGLQ